MLKLFRAAVLFATAVGPLLLNAPETAAQTAGQMELGANYVYVRTNAPPGGCGCFSMNGGSGWFSFNFDRSLALVGEVASQRASNIGGAPADLTLTSFLGGPRLSWRRSNRVVPFGQFLLGGAHASGSFASGVSSVGGSENAFALTAGGGVDVKVSRHLAVRAFQVDYYLTRFANGVNDHQNNLRLGAGIVIGFGRNRE